MSELKLERELLKESTRLDNINVYELNYDQATKILKEQDEAYHKWKFLSKYRKAKEKLNEKSNQKDIKK